MNLNLIELLCIELRAFFPLKLVLLLIFIPEWEISEVLKFKLEKVFQFNKRKTMTFHFVHENDTKPECGKLNSNGLIWFGLARFGSA